jgi:hypothetical protein
VSWALRWVEVSHLLLVELRKPEALNADLWAAITDSLARLKSAVASADRSLTIGTAKDLVEAVAREVLASR